MKTKSILFISLATVAAGFITSCSQSEPIADDNYDLAHRPAPPGFTVSMTDSPGDYSELNVEITKVEAYLDDKGWVTLNNTIQYVNVLKLTNGEQVQLAQSHRADEGSYSVLRLTFGNDNYVRLKNSRHLAGMAPGDERIKLSMAEDNQVEIDIYHNVNKKSGAAVLLDFNVAQSITREGNEWILHPVITEIEDITTGIRGYLDNKPGAAILLSDGVYTYSTYVNEEGEFLLRGVDPGTYDMMVVPAGETILGGNEHLIEGVTVTAGEITQMGNIHL